MNLRWLVPVGLVALLVVGTIGEADMWGAPVELWQVLVAGGLVLVTILAVTLVRAWRAGPPPIASAPDQGRRVRRVKRR